MENKKYPIGGYAPGNYQCHCVTCGGGFIGDKRAHQCEPCAVRERDKFDALSPHEQEELIRRNVDAFKKHIKGNNSNEQLSGADQVCGKTELNNLAAISNVPPGPRWVRASERVPENDNLVHINYRTNNTTFKLTGFYEPSQKKWYRQSRGALEWAPNLEWLDESPEQQSDMNIPEDNSPKGMPLPADDPFKSIMNHDNIIANQLAGMCKAKGLDERKNYALLKKG